VCHVSTGVYIKSLENAFMVFVLCFACCLWGARAAQLFGGSRLPADQQAPMEWNGTHPITEPMDTMWPSPV
jgi:hypothetical protein